MTTKKSTRAIILGMLVAFVGLGSGVAISQTPAGQEAIRSLPAPFDITPYFYPSGWMGDGEDEGGRHIQMDDAFRGESRPNDTDNLSILFRYQPGSKGWAGVYWQYPSGNWGDQAGTHIQEATKISFWARGDQGGERVEFKAGGIFDSKNPYRDSFEKSMGFIYLTKQWRRYSIDLRQNSLSHVIGAFAWIAKRSHNPDGLVFYLDDIRYE